MAPSTAFSGRGADLGDRVHDAVRVRRSAGHHEHGAVVHGRSHRSGPCPELIVDVDHHGLDPEVVRGLVERRVSRDRQHHPRAIQVGW